MFITEMNWFPSLFYSEGGGYELNLNLTRLLRSMKKKWWGKTCRIHPHTIFFIKEILHKLRLEFVFVWVSIVAVCWFWISVECSLWVRIVEVGWNLKQCNTRRTMAWDAGGVAHMGMTGEEKECRIGRVGGGTNWITLYEEHRRAVFRH